MMHAILDAALSLLAPRPRRGLSFPGVTLYGDSIMHGGIGRYLSELGAGPVIDRSLPGDTARNAWRRMPYELRGTACVVLQLGTNDVTGGIDPVPYLARMVRYVRAEGRLPILTGLSRRADGAHAAVNERIARMAATELLPWADWGSVPLDAPDGLHPAEPMARALAARLMAALPPLSEGNQ